MGRGKIEIKKIENPTNRQVTYSKRRNGIFKKAQELTVLCDAKVSLIMFSNTNKFHEYISPSTTTKKIYDQYQKALGIDLWSAQYEKMQEQLRKLKDINHKLKKEIRQRIGEDLNELSIDHLRVLEQNMTEALNGVRGRKEAKMEDPRYGLVDSEGDYESAAALVNGASNLYAFRLHQGHHHHHSNLHLAGGFGPHDLRLP
ncbi:hypothetical protein Peur_013259 [Populus x canadensis]